MDIYLLQVEKRPRLLSYLLAAFAICTMLLLSLSFSQFFEQRRAMPSTSLHVIHMEGPGVPVAISAPHPPEEQIQISDTSLPSSGANPAPQVVPISVPSVP